MRRVRWTGFVMLALAAGHGHAGRGDRPRRMAHVAVVRRPVRNGLVRHPCRSSASAMRVAGRHMRRRRANATALAASLLAHVVAGVLMLAHWASRPPPQSMLAPVVVVELLPRREDMQTQRERPPPAKKAAPAPPKVTPRPARQVPAFAPPPLTIPSVEPPPAPDRPEETSSPPKPDPGPPTPPPPSSTAPAPDSWEGRVLARLEAVKRYPSAARVRRMQGVAFVRFRATRAGDVVFARLERGSGHDVLDRAAIETVRRARPLPTIPSDRPEEIEIVVPVEFFLR
jgi:protein TonB